MTERNGTHSTPERLWTADDLAERWQVRKAYIYHLSRTGQIPCLRLGRYFRYVPASIRSYEQANEEGGPGV